MRAKLSNASKRKLIMLETPTPFKSIWQYLQVYIAIFIAIYFALKIQSIFFNVVTILFIAGRQHSLYILNHDASHYSLFRSKIINKIIATVFSNLVMFHHPEAWSFIQWRRIHLLHHSQLFTEKDPNYIARQQAGDTLRNHTVTQLLFSCLLSVPQVLKQFFWGKQNYVNPKIYQISPVKVNHLATLIINFKNDAEMSRERWSKLLFLATSLFVITYYHFWQHFVLYWLLPMYSFYPMILRFHDLTEHQWQVKSKDIHLNTCSVQIGFLGKVLFSFLPRGFHREHHLFPKVSVKHLPELNKMLDAEGVIAEPTHKNQIYILKTSGR